MSKKNKNLNLAKVAKNDEFYTQLEDIEKELEYYKRHFKNKTIFCNCDDSAKSEFWKYFHLNFTKLGLKKLISTHYDFNEPTYKLEYEGGSDNDIKVGIKTVLMQNGDFRSNECIELLKEADIVVTNPPFSLFREYVAQLIEYDKKFIIIGSTNAITYKEFFPLLKSNRVWLGNNTIKEFKQPDGSIKKFGNICWYTNLDISKRHNNLILHKKYTSEEYPTYDNFNAINVDKISEIPCDYDGVMGVPITFLSKYNPEQFEIIELSRYLKTNGMSKEFVEQYFREGNKSHIHEGHPDLCYYNKNGKTIVPYTRIMIRRKGKVV